MKNQYRNSIVNLPEVIRLLIIYFVINSTLLYIVNINLEDDKETIFFIGYLLLSFYLLIFLLPVLILFFDYTQKTKNITLTLNKENIIINDKVILITEIKTVKIFATHQHFNLKYGGVTTLPYNDSFYYMQLETAKDNYYLTSLLSYNLDKIFLEKYPEVIYLQVIKSFPLIK